MPNLSSINLEIIVVHLAVHLGYQQNVTRSYSIDLRRLEDNNVALFEGKTAGAGQIISSGRVLNGGGSMNSATVLFIPRWLSSDTRYMFIAAYWQISSRTIDGAIFAQK
ncbi:hypothetical protein SERLA73DRAFT_78171 [Serpula lacrymans var. lacrymans S7.3]|uniref:Uncharacterized protein n=2 Tax=Serpula lacrymans var. lacrymans TaxID=341189 RepID=F8QCC8_SERL3|nr:uncharacterized protein SERLADRAFT_443207 [Serpula lacrymans var. lacrymans S7.9]EGN93793.1 hypothetical protein SERLA73DRAFT_78171 [Serpula lacrymans var. lacrymans S7.3]EGO19164.1 hypothetical protein SERLADRAFT_443207 [Serpula lacrymans var. lacrymans S7.9]